MSVKNELLKDELREWGVWAVRKGLYLGYRSVDYGLPSSTQQPNITDDRAMQIDKVVSILRARDELTVKVLLGAYVQGLNVRDIAREYQMNKDKAAKILEIGISCVGMGLEIRAANDDFF